MEDISRILVLSRMTVHCRLAIHCAISLAKKYQAALSVLHAVNNPVGLEGWKHLPLKLNSPLLMRKAREDIDAAIRAEQAQGMEIKEIIREGDPIEMVMDVVKEENIDLLISLAHKEGHLEHFLFGRSNEELVRRMPCSIFLVKKEPAIFGEVD